MVNKLQRLCKQHPELKDEKFRKEYPRIVEVIDFLEPFFRERSLTPKSLADSGISTLRRYVESVHKGDKAAVRVYKSISEILG